MLRSRRCKSSPYRSAMSMLNFDIHRAGRNLTVTQRKEFKAPRRSRQDGRQSGTPAEPLMVSLIAVESLFPSGVAT
jgi:hypothetical protein